MLQIQLDDDRQRRIIAWWQAYGLALGGIEQRIGNYLVAQQWPL
jgi:hypothetical protein